MLSDADHQQPFLRTEPQDFIELDFTPEENDDLVPSRGGVIINDPWDAPELDTEEPQEAWKGECHDFLAVGNEPEQHHERLRNAAFLGKLSFCGLRSAVQK